MKKTLLTCLVMFSSLMLLAQTATVDSTFYYDYEGKPTTKKSRATHILTTKTKGKVSIHTLTDSKNHKISERYYQAKVDKNNPTTLRWYEHGSFIEWFNDSTKSKEGSYFWGLKEGRFIEYYSNGKPQTDRTYHLDTLIKSTFYTENGTEYVELGGDLKRPQYPQGDSAMFKYLASNIRVPLDIVKNHQSISIKIRLTIDKNGVPYNSEVIGFRDNALDKTVAEAIKKMHHFEPATKNGEPVESNILLEEIKFSFSSSVSVKHSSIRAW